MGGYRELTEAQVEEFVATGIVRIEGAFSRSFAAEWVRRALERLGRVDDRGVGAEVYARAPPEDEIEAKVLAPRAWAAIEDLLGGADRVDQAAWRGSAGGGAVWQSDLAGNFGSAAERAKGDASWVEPSARDERNIPVGSWHKVRLSPPLCHERPTCFRVWSLRRASPTMSTRAIWTALPLL